MRGRGSLFCFNGVVLWHLVLMIFVDAVCDRVADMTREPSESATQYVRCRRQR